ncbi:hypothetical protein QMK33_16270 [Hymenobacter sp. H14-R3]|uniref:hypothetical protein n=1 Tax=Hymenobacter sp. H14-R3 TaxID=3046308 RepID=UPI0024B8834C|nr:hypothetical protein [Hymenobacter sp. H14-R3]MDJ0366714.1 hypothetical protein [Hymenobacter sp. H14-R3]
MGSRPPEHQRQNEEETTARPHKARERAHHQPCFVVPPQGLPVCLPPQLPRRRQQVHH